MSAYNLICGMEIHAELATKSKMFCGCANDPFGAEKPNTHTCPVCLGMPGALPVANKTAIDWVIQIGLALHCEINLFSKFDRKHYFYPDLPKGYQISQYDIPFCENGYIDTAEGRVRIRRIHLEEDTAKLQHTEIDGKKVSLIDFNRGGVPLVEIVTEPDIHSAAQAKEYSKKIRQILRYLQVANCDMEQGGMRLEANISLQTPGATELPDYKVELKNINSFRFLEQAILFDISRQEKLLLAGETPVQETRGYNSVKGTTFSQRTKEAAEDYRYFPDPDLPPMRFSQADIDALRAALPELPDARTTRWMAEYDLSEAVTEQLVAQRETAEWFEEIFAALSDARERSLIANDFLNGKLSAAVGDASEKTVKTFHALHATESLDTDKLTEIATTVLEQNSDAVAKYRSGKTQIIGFLIGQFMQQAKIKLDPQVVKALLEKLLAN